MKKNHCGITTNPQWTSIDNNKLLKKDNKSFLSGLFGGGFEIISNPQPYLLQNFHFVL